MKSIERLPLLRLELLQYHSAASPSKRIKILNKNHPSDFFVASEGQRKMNQFAQEVRKESQSHQTHRRNNSRLMVLSMPRREMSTALERKDNDEDLIMGVISTAREIRKMIRKHSLELKKSVPNGPAELRIELPKIAMGRGETTAF